MEAAEGGVARSATGDRHVLGCCGDLGLGGGVGRNSGGDEAGNGKCEDKKANNVVFHDISPWRSFFVFLNFSLDKPTGYNIRCIKL